MPPAPPIHPVRDRRRLALAVAASVAAAAWLGVPSRRAAAQEARPPFVNCPDNRLVNPGFEAGFSVRDRPDEIVGRGWSPWYDVSATGGLTAPSLTARRGDEALLDVPFGMWLQEIGSDVSPHVGGLWQQVRVPADVQVQASIWAYAWASSADQALVSTPPGTYATTLGLDPQGGTDPHAATVAWSQPITVTDRWVPLAIDVNSPGPRVTLFVRGQPLAQLRHMVSRWDGACLRVAGSAFAARAAPPATPRPTPTADPRRPGPTDDPIVAILRGTALAVDAAAAATARAPQRALGARLSITDSGVFVGPGSADGLGRERPVPTPLGAPLADEPVTVTPVMRLIDHSGLIVLALAAFVAGAVAGLRGWTDIWTDNWTNKLHGTGP
ncbi:MAG: hypothetical protein IT332_09115 [Ardenticatenales bacterium]|nr:hypothetical protein [Ardenticatenales bacterium]